MTSQSRKRPLASLMRRVFPAAALTPDRSNPPPRDDTALMSKGWTCAGNPDLVEEPANPVLDDELGPPRAC